MGLTATTEGVTVTAGEKATPQVSTIGSLDNTKQGCVVVLEGLTYNATNKVLTDASGASIAYYDGFSTGFTPEDGKTYDATGIVLFYDVLQIAPRSADDFVEAGTTIVVAKPVITPNGGTYTAPQEVTITADEGCTIIYTTDGSDPGYTAGSQYTAPFTVSEDCVVKAIAFDEDDNSSAVATAEFKFITAEAIPTIARLCAAAPAEGETDVLVEFNNWIVTGVKGGQVFFTDGANGIVNYIKDHGFGVGDVVTGSAIVTLITFNECAEITSLTSTTEGVTVTKGEGAAPMSVAIADLQKDMQGCLLRFEGLTYDGSAFADEDDNTIVPSNKFITLPTLSAGKTYNVTGVAIWFVKDGQGHWEIAPRTAEEIELITSQIAPESSWNVGEVIVDITEEVGAEFSTNSDGTVTYSSSDESVATIDEQGVITLVGRGITTITANVAETETYLADSKSFKLIVTQDGYADALFVYNDEDIVGQGAPDVGAELTATRNGIVTLYANRAYAKEGDTHIKVYGSNDKVEEGQGPSYIKLSTVEGYLITKIVMTATGEGNIKEWKDQYDTAAVIEGATATWEGELNEVVLTNQASAQARIKTIAVTYVDTSIIDAISAPTSVVEETAIYNLAGQRLSKMQKGINIVGGKKIAIK